MSKAFFILLVFVIIATPITIGITADYMPEKRFVCEPPARSVVGLPENCAIKAISSNSAEWCESKEIWIKCKVLNER